MFTTGVENAVCRKALPNTSELEAWLNAQNSLDPERKSSHVSGYYFTNENPAFISAFVKLTQNLTLARSATSSCQKVICAIEELYGKEAGLRMLYIMLKYGFNTAPSKLSTNSFTISELEDIHAALQDFPRHAFPPAKASFAYEPAQNDILGMTLSDGFALNDIVLTQTWRNLATRELKQYTVTHELGHLISTQLGKLKDAREWRKISTSDHQVIPEKAVSIYALDNSGEDFAESVAAYRYNPELLWSQSQEKYHFIKYTIFDGIEYRNRSQCEGAKSLSEELREKFGEPNSIPEHDIEAYLLEHRNMNSPLMRKIVIQRLKF